MKLKALNASTDSFRVIDMLATRLRFDKTLV